MTTQTDDQLVAKAQSGDARAFEALVERHCGLVYAIGYARLGQREAVEDLTQEVFLRVHLFLDRYRANGQFPAWLSRIARNLAIDWLRRGQTASRLVPLLPLEEGAMDQLPDTAARNPRSAAATGEAMDAVEEALQHLPAMQREIVLLHHCEELSQRLIAERLGVNQATVSRHLGHALKALRGRLVSPQMEAMRTLRVSPRTVARTVFVTGVAAGLSASAKASLVATAGGMAATSVSGGAGGSGVLAVALTTLITGAKTMASAKMITVGIAALAIVGSGVLMLNTVNGNGGDSAPPRVDRDALAQFEAAMALGPGENVRLVADIPEAARLAYFREHSSAAQIEAMPQGPDAFVIYWQGNEPATRYQIFGGSCTVQDLLQFVGGMSAGAYEGEDSVLQHVVLGDIAVRDHVSTEARLPELEEAIRQSGFPVRFRHEEVMRSVLVARGQVNPQTNDIEEGPEPANAGTPSWEGPVSAMTNSVGRRLGRWVVNETTTPQSTRIRWSLWNPHVQITDAEALAEVLAGITEQTGITFTEEMRRVRQLFVERVR